jgi:glutamate/tyrosine decarboxylase-like PLP-dependent enzyme
MQTDAVRKFQPVADATLEFAAVRARQYVRKISDRRVAPDQKSLAVLTRLHEPFPQDSTDPLEVISMLDEIGSPATVATTGGRYFGFVTGGALPASMAANWLAAAWDQNASLRVMSPIAAELEDIVLRWVYEALDLPADCEGGLVTSATVANFAALVAARYALLKRAGWDVGDDGMFGAPPIQVIVGEQVHASVLKALSLAGFGKKRLTVVEADSQGRMRAEKLPPCGDRTIVCIQAGNVNTGAFDPAAEICAKAKEQGAWVHVDGAFGLWAAVSPKLQHLTSGFNNADSWATDAHKWPNVSYDCGIVIVRAIAGQPSALRSAMALKAAYLEPGTQREPMHHVPGASRRARGVELWAALKSLGRSGLISLVERTCSHANRLAEGLRAAGLDVLNDVVINQVLVSFGSAETTQEVIRRIQEDGTCWCGGTVWHGKPAMRISISSWATTEADVDRSLAAMVRIARETQSQHP